MKPEELRRLLGIDEKEGKVRKEFFTLKKEDEELLKKLGEVLDRHADEIIEKFYEHLLSFPETKAFFKDEETLKKVKGYQRAYFRRLTKGNYDLKYFEERLKIGEAHDRAALPLKLYIGAYGRYCQIVAPMICKELGYKDCEATLPAVAFSKIMFLDMSLAIDAYIAAREARVKESEEKYRTLIETTPLCVKVFNEKGNLVFINKGGREEHFLKDDADITKWDWLGTVKEEYRDKVSGALNRALKGENSHVEYEHMPEGSKNKWCTGILSPIKDEKGEVKSVLFYSHDITEQKRAEEGVKEHAKNLAILNAISETAARSLTVNEILTTCLKKALELMDIDAGEIYLLDEAKGELVHAVSHGLSEEFERESKKERFKVGEGIPGMVVKTGAPYISEDISKDPIFLRKEIAKKEGFRCLFSAPLRSKEKMLGAMLFFDCKERKFTPLYADTLASIGYIMGVALENAKLYELTKSSREKLQERVKELETFHRVTVGRELKMIELEKKVEELEARLKEMSREENTKI